MRTNNSKLISRQYFWDTEIGHGSWNVRFSCSLEILRLFISSKLSQGSTNAKKVARCIWFTDRIDATPYVTEGRRRREKEEGIKNFMNFARWTRYNNEISRLILGLFINAPFPKNVFEKFSTNAISAGCNRRRRLKPYPVCFSSPSAPLFSRGVASREAKLRLCNRPTCRSPVRREMKMIRVSRIEGDCARNFVVERQVFVKIFWEKGKRMWHKSVEFLI